MILIELENIEIDTKMHHRANIKWPFLGRANQGKMSDAVACSRSLFCQIYSAMHAQAHLKKNNSRELQ
jgi:hypothetical protein